MSFPAYPTYKNSGVDWLGVVPDHWAVTLLKRGYEVVLGKMLQPEAKRDDDEFLPYLRAANVQLSGVDTVDVKRMWFSSEEKKSLLLRLGDLLVSEGGDVGRSAIWDYDEECYFQNSINRIRSIDGNSTRFLYFWMIAIKINGYIDVLCNKSTIAHFTAEKVAAVPLPIPTKSEQTQIARFLDHETARIDALIAEQQRLIELLKEKRQAVISHAVTKGLDPTVPMKDSCVEWLGEVPAHWHVKKLKNVTRQIIDGAHFTPTYVDAGVPFIRVTDIQTQDLDLDSIKRIPEGEHCELIKRCNPEKGDVLLSKNGTIGITKIVDWDFEFSIFVSLCLLKPAQNITSKYLVNVLSGNYATEQFKGSGQKTSVTNLHLEKIREIFIALPDKAEQLSISSFIEQKTAELDLLISEARLGNNFLQERRSALISAAVTGKIDVRGWQPPASAQAPELAQEAM